MLCIRLRLPPEFSAMQSTEVETLEASPRSVKRLKATHSKGASSGGTPTNGGGEVVGRARTTSFSQTSALEQKKRSPECPAALKRRGSDDEERIAKIAGACHTILEALGEDPQREGLLRTPRRMAELLVDCTSGYAKRLEDVECRVGGETSLGTGQSLERSLDKAPFPRRRS